MRILFFGELSRKKGFDNPSEAQSLTDGLSVLVQGARLNDIQCGLRNPGRVFASEIEDCNAIVLVSEGSMTRQNEYVQASYRECKDPPAVLWLQHAPPREADTPQPLIPEFVIRLDAATPGDDNTWTADKIAIGEPWKTLAPQIDAVVKAATRGDTDMVASAIQGRLANANRLINELRAKIEQLEVGKQPLQSLFDEEDEETIKRNERLEAVVNELAAEKEANACLATSVEAAGETIRSLEAKLAESKGREKKKPGRPKRQP